MKQHTSNGKNRVLLMTYCLIVLASLSAWGQNEASEQTDLTAGKKISQIETDVDPQYVYDYEKTKFVPPNGKSLLIMGQTVECINEYLDHFSNREIPGGWSAYTAISEFTGVTSPHKNITGSTQHHQMLVDKFPNTVIQSAMWMVGTWEVAKKAGMGEYDAVVRQYAAWAKSANRPIYLRIGYEFDGPHNALEPEEYVTAYKRIVDLLRAEGADNIAFVWHSFASKPYKNYSLSAWYPGDDYVDWVGISVFDHAYGGSDFGSNCETVLQFAKQHKKPVMIAESNPVQGIAKEDAAVWDQWFVNYFNFIIRKNIKAFSFINENWPQIGIEGISHWKDARLYNNQEVSNAWFREASKDRYLKQSPQLFEQLGYSKNED